ncbi:MAG: 2,3-bisphosphoglycerate-independent phosphoglycerate mutase [Firmicutes bacterium]|nr:2,3-bisphosphoglycerate-independent phosphoglycerate mutase [Bacillota bacterium]
MDRQTTVLMILDGYGLSDRVDGNAIAAAATPNLDRLFSTYPRQKGFASGLAVGLPDGQMGNSEVGHLNIGAGRVVMQQLTLIGKSITDGDFFSQKPFLDAADNCKKHDSALHLYGLVSDGGVHSHNTHLYALLELARRHGLTKVFVHAFMDGRDTSPSSGAGFLAELEEKMAETGVGKIATVMGRYYAMDRDARWERVKLAYDAMVLGEGDRAASAAECMKKSYAAGVYDEFVKPCVIARNGAPIAAISENDSVIFFNFRGDRAREITRAFCDPNFADFGRARGFFRVFYVCFTEYDRTIPNCLVVFHEQSLENNFGEYVSKLGLTQLRLAETTKYAHVTFFFNGGREEPYPGEDRILVPTPNVATFDLKPEMSAYGVTERLVAAVLSRKYDVIIINYANCDMVGHTGVFAAAVRAVEVVDECVGKAVEALLSVGGQMLLCADHGNSDKMVDYETGEAFTEHTTNPVPVALINCEKARGLKIGGRLCDIAPTLLEMMGIVQREEMTGRSLLD